MKTKKHRAALGLPVLMTLGGCASISDRCYEKPQTVRAVQEHVICGTRETPLPGCDKPYDDGSCGPCTDLFIGISAESEMIETALHYDMPPAAMFEVAPIIQEQAEDADLDSSSNKESDKKDSDKKDSDRKDAGKKPGSDEDSTPESLLAPNVDDSVRLSLPQSQPLAMLVEDQGAGPQAELTLIPGRTYETVQPQPVASSTQDQQQGVVRLVTEPRFHPSTDPLTDEPRIVVIGSADMPFEMIEIEPIVKRLE